MPDTTRDVETYVYRLRAYGGELLYVGVAEDLFRRLKQHMRGKDWWGEVDTIEFEIWISRALALREESLAIRAETPKYNKIGVSGDWHDLAARYPFLEEWRAEIEAAPTIDLWVRRMADLENAFDPSDDWYIAQHRITAAYKAGGGRFAEDESRTMP